MGCHSHVRRKFLNPPSNRRGLSPGSCVKSPTSITSKSACAKPKTPPCARPCALPKSHGSPAAQESHRQTCPPAFHPAQSKLGKAISYAINQWPNLETYLADGRVEICNNLVENAIRPTKLGAKSWLFLGNEESGQKCAILYTIVENCRRLGINPKEYLTDVLTPPARYGGQRRRHADPSQLAQSPQRQARAYGGVTS